MEIMRSVSKKSLTIQVETRQDEHLAVQEPKGSITLVKIINFSVSDYFPL